MMTREEKKALLDSLTSDQLNGIAELIKSVCIAGDYYFNGEDSVWVESTQETIDNLAAEFSTHDKDSVLD